MAKPQRSYACQDCGTLHTKWSGKCEGCGAWNTLVEETALATPKGLSKGKGHVLTFIPMNHSVASQPRIQTQIEELDRVLGGGLVAGSAVLIGGDPGIGKSTLLLQAVYHLAKAGHKVAYISGEESVAQIQLRAQRLNVSHAGVNVATANSVRDVLTVMDGADAPDVLVIDSIQTMFVDNLESAPGTVAQVRAASHELITHAKRKDIVLLLVGHVTKDGQIAGPRVLEHMVDTVLYFEGDRGMLCRVLRAVKNRFGATDEIGVFSMTDGGLMEVANPSSLFLSDRSAAVSGSVVFAGVEGTRPMLLEIQALVTPSGYATPRRAVVGWDQARLAMVLAVLETRGNVRFADREVYLSVTGGLRVQEPAADLAVAVALLSAHANAPFPMDTVVFGEVGLTGEIRPVSRSETRLREAAKLGFKQAFCALPKREKSKAELTVTTPTHIQELLQLLPFRL